MKEQSVIRVFDFTEYPGPRYILQGEDSGEKFYLDFVKPAFEKALENKGILEIDLDYTAGYAPSFIDETFGNLVYDFNMQSIRDHIKIKSDDEPHWIDLINDDIYPKWLKKKKAGQPRKPDA